MDGLKFLGSK
uniref:Uncharacterized protein n=1 Tax=Arundo donax TaxID=35708 RepID=A0A0A9AQ83_ARUDO